MLYCNSVEVHLKNYENELIVFNVWSLACRNPLDAIIGSCKPKIFHILYFDGIEN